MYQIILDGAMRVGLTVAGGFVGKTVGWLVFGPAGALVLGPALPVLSQTQTTRVIDSVVCVLPDYVGWAEEVSASIDNLVRRLEAALEAKTAILRTKYQSLGRGVLDRCVTTRIEDDARFCENRRCASNRRWRLRTANARLRSSPGYRTRDLRNWFRSVIGERHTSGSSGQLFGLSRPETTACTLSAFGTTPWLRRITG